MVVPLDELQSTVTGTSPYSGYLSHADEAADTEGKGYKINSALKRHVEAKIRDGTVRDSIRSGVSSDCSETMTAGMIRPGGEGLSEVGEDLTEVMM